MNLRRKNIVDIATCEVCGSEDETSEHIIDECSIATSFLASVGIDLLPKLCTKNLAEITYPNHLLKDSLDVYRSVLLAVAEADERCGFQGRSSILAPTHCLMEK
jgi:hypothetical protein